MVGSSVVSTILSATRLFVIKYPFIKIPKRYVVLSLIVMGLVVLVPIWTFLALGVWGTSLFSNETDFDPTSEVKQKLQSTNDNTVPCMGVTLSRPIPLRWLDGNIYWDQNLQSLYSITPISHFEIYFWIPYDLNCLLGLCCSLYTLILIRKAGDDTSENFALDRSNQKKSCKTIFLLNTVNAFYIACEIMVHFIFTDGFREFWLLTAFVLPVMSAGCNPVIIITRSGALKGAVKCRLAGILAKVTRRGLIGNVAADQSPIDKHKRISNMRVESGTHLQSSATALSPQPTGD